MAIYTYAPAPVLVEITGEFAIGATGVFRATEGGTPVTITDLNDSPIPNIVVGPKGAHQAFKADIPNGVIDFGSVLLPTASLEQQEAALQAEQIAAQAAVDAAAAAASSQAAAAAAAAAEGSAAAAAASAEAVPDAVQDIVAEQVQPGPGIEKELGAGNNTLTLSVIYGETAGTAVEGNDPRVTDGQFDSVASIRRNEDVPGGSAPFNHQHPVGDITGLAAVILDLLGAATASDARAVLGVGNRADQEVLVLWEQNGAGTKWGTARPTGYKRVRFAANGATGTEDPALTIGLDVDVWETL